MNAKLQQLRVVQNFSDQPRIALVTASVSGEATEICMQADNKNYPVVAHASGVEALQDGDHVLTVMTPDGAVITHKIRIRVKPHEHDGVGDTERVHEITAAGGIRLSSGAATLELTADGCVLLNGKQIFAIADGLQRLQGSTIELN